MKIYQTFFVALFFALFLISGCSKPPVTSENQTDSKSEYKLLYNPPPGGNPENIGKIIYASDPRENPITDYDIYTINPDGSNKTKLTSHAIFTNHPVWSPEYSRFAYTTSVDFADKIFIMTVDGSESRQLTFGDSDDKFPTWSPDGQWIAYISYQNKIPNLWVMDIYGENKKQLTFAPEKDNVVWPDWMPNGEYIVYTYNDGATKRGSRLHMIKPDGTGDRELLSLGDSHTGDSEATWSPDGQTMYFISNRNSHVEIWKIDFAKLKANNYTETADNAPVKVTDLKSVNTSIDHRPRVSPDGTKIVFYGVGPDWNDIGTNLYTINVDGSGLTNITKSKDGNEWADW